MAVPMAIAIKSQKVWPGERPNKLSPAPPLEPAKASIFLSIRLVRCPFIIGPLISPLGFLLGFLGGRLLGSLHIPENKPIGNRGVPSPMIAGNVSGNDVNGASGRLRNEVIHKPGEIPANRTAKLGEGGSIREIDRKHGSVPFGESVAGDSDQGNYTKALKACQALKVSNLKRTLREAGESEKKGNYGS